jgi:hypothetical protein
MSISQKISSLRVIVVKWAKLKLLCVRPITLHSNHVIIALFKKFQEPISPTPLPGEKVKTPVKTPTPKEPTPVKPVTPVEPEQPE